MLTAAAPPTQAPVAATADASHDRPPPGPDPMKTLLLLPLLLAACTTSPKGKLPNYGLHGSRPVLIR